MSGVPKTEDAEEERGESFNVTGMRAGGEAEGSGGETWHCG
jgi:hypothetical protein